MSASCLPIPKVPFGVAAVGVPMCHRRASRRRHSLFAVVLLSGTGLLRRGNYVAPCQAERAGLACSHSGLLLLLRNQGGSRSYRAASPMRRRCLMEG
jgi:hypothetical protein